LAALSFTTVLTAQTTNPFFRHIPSDADQVYHINLAALGSKLSWSDISGMIPPPKGATDQEMMKYVNDPSLTGIDFHQGLVIAVGHLAKNTDSPSCITIMAQLSDSGKLMSLVRSATKGLHTFKLPGKVSVAGKEKMAVAWNDKMAVVTIIIAPKSQQTATGTAMVSSSYYTLTAAKKSAAALEGFTNSTYTTNATFINGFSDDADLHIWAPQGSIMKQLSEMSKKKNPVKIKVPTWNSQLYSLSALRFDAGRITFHTTTIIPPDSAEVYKFYNSRPLNTDLITHIPDKAILGMVNTHFDPLMIKSTIERYHLRPIFDSLLSSKGLSIDDILKVPKGDFLVAATHPNQIPDTGKVEPNFYFVATIADLGALMKVAGKLGLSQDSLNAMGKKIGFTLKNNILVIGRKGQTESFFSTNNPANLNLVNDGVRNSVFSMVLDIKAVSAYLKASQRGDEGSSRKAQQILHFMSALDHMTVTTGSYHNGILESNFELTMTDPSQNSLRSLFNLLH